MSLDPQSALRRAVILGAGGIAGKFKAALAEIEGVRLVAASARTPGKAAAFLAGVNDEQGRLARSYIDSREMLQRERPDFAIDCSPSGAHFDNILLCAEEAVDLLSEKPIVMGMHQLQDAVAAAAEAGIKVGGVFQHRYLPCYQELHAALAEGRFGRLSAINVCVPWFRGEQYYRSGEWRGKPESDGGAVMNQGSHEVDLALWLGSAALRLPRGQNPVEMLSAFTSNVAHQGLITVEDTATVNVLFRNGALGSWYFSTAANSKEEGAKSVSVFGSGGSVVIAGNAVARWDFVEELPKDAEIRSRCGVSTSGNASKNPLAIAHGPHRANVEAFMAWLDGDDGFELDIVGAGMAPVTIDAIYESAKTGGSVVAPSNLGHLMRLANRVH